MGKKQCFGCLGRESLLQHVALLSGYHPELLMLLGKMGLTWVLSVHPVADADLMLFDLAYTHTTQICLKS